MKKAYVLFLIAVSSYFSTAHAHSAGTKVKLMINDGAAKEANRIINIIQRCAGQSFFFY
ncbi:MAG: hypothetical protein ABI416_13415 [Ginsengibacter sp.]